MVMEGVMNHEGIKESAKLISFGRRKVAPRVCVADNKQHIRRFLGEALEELGFITCECMQVSDLGALLDAQLPDLVVLDLSGGGVAAGEMLEVLANKEFSGKVLLLGPRDSYVVEAVRELGNQLRIAMLPALVTPFSSETLRDSVAGLLPAETPQSAPVDAAEAVRAGWLELWYQPMISTRTLAVQEAEGLIRLRHPTWGIVPPAYFIPDDGDPHFRELSEFVIGQAIRDWRYFVTQQGPLEIAINLPITFLQDPESIKRLCRQIPGHPAFEGLIIEVNGTDVIPNMELLKEVARELRFHNIAIAIDDLGAEWPALIGLSDFPFVEVKVDRKFIAGCADDRLKRAMCGRIRDLADSYGARTVAEGVETRADFLAVREMGFDLVQGFLFAKPIPAKKFARTIMGRPMTVPQ
jgi:EAL domain-containing protein (putative c-di-GMP-specific phosphodiesterase class I)/CheY-like chemotaxis protein